MKEIAKMLFISTLKSESTMLLQALLVVYFNGLLFQAEDSAVSRTPRRGEVRHGGGAVRAKKHRCSTGVALSTVVRFKRMREDRPQPSHSARRPGKAPGQRRVLARQRHNLGRGRLGAGILPGTGRVEGN